MKNYIKMESKENPIVTNSMFENLAASKLVVVYIIMLHADAP